MNSKNKEVMKKILYAVETGGQVYGNQRYDDFTEVYTNSDGEKAITIGAGQWYAEEARRLLKLIRDTNFNAFVTLDYAGIGSDIDTANWTTYRISETSNKARCIQQIISSDTGIQCQDNLMYQQIDEYSKKITDRYGELSDMAMMECINIIHQGGSEALKRILAKTQKPYTVDSIYAALCTDPGDISNNNQVGDYVSRQKAVYEMIKTYAEGGQEMSKGAFKAVELATSREGKNQYTQSAKREQVFSGYSDCSSLWWKAYEKAYNIQIGTWTGAQVDKGIQIARYGGETALTEADYKKLQVGDLIFFGAGEAKHVEGFAGWKNDIPMLFGHGSGTPSFKNGLTYRHSAGYYQARRYYTEEQPDNIGNGTNTKDGRNTVLYAARIKKDTVAYTWAGTDSAKSKTYPTIKKDTLVDVMDYTQKDKNGKNWYFVRLCHPSEGFVSIFVPSGSFRHFK